MGTDDLTRISLSVRLLLSNLAMLMRRTLNFCTCLLEFLSNLLNYHDSTLDVEFAVLAVLPWLDCKVGGIM